MVFILLHVYNVYHASTCIERVHVLAYIRRPNAHHDDDHECDHAKPRRGAAVPARSFIHSFIRARVHSSRECATRPRARRRLSSSLVVSRRLFSTRSRRRETESSADARRQTSTSIRPVIDLDRRVASRRANRPSRVDRAWVISRARCVDVGRVGHRDDSTGGFSRVRSFCATSRS